jgi:hypothetical protein
MQGRSSVWVGEDMYVVIAKHPTEDWKLEFPVQGITLEEAKKRFHVCKLSVGGNLGTLELWFDDGAGNRTQIPEEM